MAGSDYFGLRGVWSDSKTTGTSLSVTTSGIQAGDYLYALCFNNNTANTTFATIPSGWSHGGSGSGNNTSSKIVTAGRSSAAGTETTLSFTTLGSYESHMVVFAMYGVVGATGATSGNYVTGASNKDYTFSIPNAAAKGGVTLTHLLTPVTSANVFATPDLTSARPLVNNSAHNYEGTAFISRFDYREIFDQLDTTDSILKWTEEQTYVHRGYTAFLTGPPDDPASISETSITATSASMTATVSRDEGLLYWYTQPDGDNPPTSSTIKSGTGGQSNGNASITAAGAKTFPVTGMAAGVLNRVYLMHTAYGINSAIVTRNVQTLGRTVAGTTEAVELTTNAATVGTIVRKITWLDCVPDQFTDATAGIVASFALADGGTLTAARLFIGHTEQTITGRTSTTLTFTCVQGDEADGAQKLQVSEFI